MMILVVEKDDSGFNLIKELLEKNNLNAIKARNLKEVEDIMDHIIVDMIVVDANMPKNEDGNEITKKIKLDYPRIPLVIKSANADPSIVFTSFYSGCDDYLVKPFSKEEFYKTVEKHCCLVNTKSDLIQIVHS